MIDAGHDYVFRNSRGGPLSQAGLDDYFGDAMAKRRGFNEAQKARVENAGVLTASGLIAGEAVLGLVWAGLQFAPAWTRTQIFQVIEFQSKWFVTSRK